MVKALLVVDMQEVCVGDNKNSFFKYDSDKLIANVNEIIKQYPKENVYYILNVMKNNFINKFAPFKAFDGSDEVKLAKKLSVVSNNIYKKYTGNAFTNKELCEALKLAQFTELEIIGVDGGGCVGYTALGAIKEGYEVVLNSKAIETMYEKKALKLNNKLRNKGARFI